jgi:hypothetical protein
MRLRNPKMKFKTGSIIRVFENLGFESKQLTSGLRILRSEKKKYNELNNNESAVIESDDDAVFD